MKYLFYLILPLSLLSCNSEEASTNLGSQEDSVSDVQSNNEFDTVQHIETEAKIIKVMVIPCSNGYEYNLKMGDLNPFLENHLKKQTKIQFKPFPLKKMKGSGYHGVFDKKHCNKIIEKADVDVLIMTKMKGDILIYLDSSQGTWGYETKILHIKKDKQIEGISANKLSAFEDIDADIASKIDRLVQFIIDLDTK
jgi:hypothetical protein